MSDSELKQPHINVSVNHDDPGLSIGIVRMRFDGIWCSCGKTHMNASDIDSRCCTYCIRPLCCAQSLFYACNDCHESTICLNCNIKCPFQGCEVRVCEICVRKNYPD